MADVEAGTPDGAGPVTFTRITTLRLPAAQADEAEYAARIDGKSLSEFIRDAIAAHLASRRADPEFRRRLEARIKADREILKRLEAIP